MLPTNKKPMYIANLCYVKFHKYWSRRLRVKIQTQTFTFIILASYGRGVIRL